MREVIEQMLVTEEEARRIVSEATREGDSVIAAARAKAVQMEESARREAQEEGARLVSEAEGEARATHDKVLARVRAEAKALKATAETMEAGVELVMRELRGAGKPGSGEGKGP